MQKQDLESPVSRIIDRLDSFIAEVQETVAAREKLTYGSKEQEPREVLYWLDDSGTWVPIT